MVLEGSTVKRTLRIGWRYMAIALGLSLLLTSELLFLGKHPGSGFATTFPLEVPLFAVLGSTAGLMTFSSDRTKGVFEYLLAYRVSPRNLFTNGLLATAAMSGLILGITCTLGIGMALVRSVPLTQDFWQAIGYYTLPMSFAGALVTSTVGMIWASVSSPRTGLNSPVGIAPMIGIGPTVLVLLVAETAPSQDYYYVTGGAALVLILLVLGLLAASARLMGREDFLSSL
jgi:ABC-type transport system involved in multi-copper enzyme maturation permease subunit